MVLFDRPNSSDNVASGTIRFSDGSNVAVGALNNDGLPLTVVFPARSATGLRFTVNSTSTKTVNIGLSELQIWTSTGPAVPTTAPSSTTAPATVATTTQVSTTVARTTVPPSPTTPTIPAATIAPAPVPPTVNSATPLNTNPSVTGTSGWGVSGATYDGTMSRTAGSGSFRFSGMFGQVMSGAVKVTPGQPYTLSAYIRTANWPTGNVSLLPVEVNSGGGFIRVLGEFGTNGAPGTINGWQEFATVIVPSGTTNYIALVANRAEDQFAGTGDMWLDDLAVVAGVQARSPSAPKKAFNGTQTRVDGLGNWEVLQNGAWKPWFPLCVAANGNRSTYTALAAGGFNCDIWNGQEPFYLEKAKAAGMRSFFNISQYYQPNGWAYRGWTDLANRIKAVNASPAADYLAGFWMDNEAPWGTFADYEQTARAVQSLDTVNGARRRPIMQLMNSTYLRAFSNNGVDFSDVLAGYSPTAGGYAPWGRTGDRLIANQLEGITQPLSLCQVASTGVNFRATIYGCLAHGGTSLSYFQDDSANPVETHGFWSELPAISREVNALLPVIRAPESGAWKISNSLGNRVWPVAMSQVHEVGGVAHMILANMTPSEKIVTFRIDASTYQAGEIRDYFTNQLLATISGNTFTLRIPGSGLTTGSLAIRLVPS